jgi:hypothetical protein
MVADCSHGHDVPPQLRFASLQCPKQSFNYQNKDKTKTKVLARVASSHILKLSIIQAQSI